MSVATETQGNIEKALRREVERLENLVGSLTQQLQEQQGTIDQLSQQLKRQQEREEKIIQPEEIPAKAKFNGYRDYDVQELKIERHNIRFRLAEYVTEEGKTIVGQLPSEYSQGHYGPNLVGYIREQRKKVG
jgi:phage-related minor tail protein